ncbi:MAG: hypothetical protein HFACDABA_01942 [Anaerolineales bacterium]|nr:hypothetical protein [Anaerolineales bacterium]
MDIRAGILAVAALLFIWALFVTRAGLANIRDARRLTFYRLKQARISQGWRLILFAALLAAAAIAVPVFGTPIAFHYFPPSPTVAPTWTPSVVPTITLSPTITLTPTITDTPLYTDTPTGTPTPFLPLAVEAQFISAVTPNPNSVISPLIFSTTLENSLPASPNTIFRNPIPHMYAVFSYDQMLPGVQWTAVWYRNGEYVFHETKPWDGSTGGFGFSDWGPAPDQWQAGVYSVQIFVGHDFKRGGTFTVEGEAPTAAATLSPTPTLTITPTP